MSSSANDKKRWAIMPPPTHESENIGDHLHVDSEAGALGTAKRRRSSEASAVSTKRPVVREKPSGAPTQSNAGTQLRPPRAGSEGRSSIQAISPQSRANRDLERAAQTEPAAAWSDEEREEHDTLPAPFLNEQIGEEQGDDGQVTHEQDAENCHTSESNARD